MLFGQVQPFSFRVSQGKAFIESKGVRDGFETHVVLALPMGIERIRPTGRFCQLYENRFASQGLECVLLWLLMARRQYTACPKTRGHSCC